MLNKFTHPFIVSYEKTSDLYKEKELQKFNPQNLSTRKKEIRCKISIKQWQVHNPYVNKTFAFSKMDCLKELKKFCPWLILRSKADASSALLMCQTICFLTRSSKEYLYQGVKWMW